ncbi:MAG: gamma-glutamyl-gamma-aminobutyrate hydrolase family protein [Actinomycetota bacterium]|jgi:gamma-glutamyl-gamma-aminobutyrate hydrolase PuuD|nr:gamma-glutamyl-gamma-aminobutyrate hydrolase family protein [Actinomycetota bacterium]
MAPLVGLTTYYQETAWGPWARRAAAVPATYVELVASSGAHPVLLPPAGSAEVVGRLDALVLIGGGDVDPAAYGRPAHPATSGVDPARDAWELALLAAALDADLPLLAVCRGHQLLNVALGGTLVQHLPDVVGHDGHQPGPGRFAPVEVVAEPGSRVAEALGPRLTVACSHHQAVDTLGEGLAVSARSTDGVIEAVELTGRRFAVGVQWHPEETGDRRLVDALVEAVRSAAAGR